MNSPSLMTARVLFSGVLVSFFLLAAGLIVSFTPSAIRALELLHAGLITLVATPVLRLLVLGAEFVTRREYAFALIALGVLSLLVVSVYIGFA